jgi:hypothetical protein
MNRITYTSDSDEEPKPKVQIHVPKVTLETYEPKAKPSTRQGLLDLLGSTLSTPAPQRPPVPQRTVKVEEEEEEEEEEVEDFFSLQSTDVSTPLSDRMVGPSKPTLQQQRQVPLLPQPQKRKAPMDDQEEWKKLVGHKDKHGAMIIHSFSVQDEVGPYQPHQHVQADTSLLVDDAFKNLDTQVVLNKNNNIMALAQQAKLQSAEFEQRKAERTHVKKLVRQKYGF